MNFKMLLNDTLHTELPPLYSYLLRCTPVSTRRVSPR